MALSSDARRRWLGVACLAVAAVMLILGQTVLKNSLRRQAFIFYWLACTVVTGLTLLIALLDMRAVRLRSQREQKELLKDVFRDITEPKEKKNDSPKKN